MILTNGRIVMIERLRGLEFESCRFIFCYMYWFVSKDRTPRMDRNFFIDLHQILLAQLQSLIRRAHIRHA